VRKSFLNPPLDCKQTNLFDKVTNSDELVG
jgi:hypothetical protein